MRGPIIIGLAAGAAALVVWQQWRAQQMSDAAPGWSWDGLGLKVFTDAADVITDAVTETGATVGAMIGLGPKASEYAAMLNESNVQAFLQVIRDGEGTAGAMGYQTMVGGGLFYDMADHPRQFVAIRSGNTTIRSSAAGAYQMLSRTWDEAKSAMGLPDFSPASQDIAALFLINRRGALDDVRAGRLDAAIRRTAKEWASLPGSPYGQPTRTMAQASNVYQSAGGVIA